MPLLKLIFMYYSKMQIAIRPRQWASYVLFFQFALPISGKGCGSNCLCKRSSFLFKFETLQWNSDPPTWHKMTKCPLIICCHQVLLTQEQSLTRPPTPWLLSTAPTKCLIVIWRLSSLKRISTTGEFYNCSLYYTSYLIKRPVSWIRIQNSYL